MSTGRAKRGVILEPLPVDDNATEQQLDSRKVWFTPTRGASNWLWLSFFVVLLDQTTKALVVGAVKLQNAIELLPILDIVYLENTGAAFSILREASRLAALVLHRAGAGVSVVLMVWLRRIRMPSRRCSRSGWRWCWAARSAT